MRALLTILILVPIYVFAILGETPAEISRKMGDPVKTDVRQNTDFPLLTYGLVYTSRGWLPIASVQNEIQDAVKSKQEPELDKIEQWLKETWGVQVVYVDEKSMCEVWIPINHKVTTNHAKLIFHVYRGDKKWTKLDSEEAASVARGFQEDLAGNSDEVNPIYLLKTDDASTYFIVFETHISIYAKGYTQRIRPSRIIGEQKQKEEDDAFLVRVEGIPLALLDWHWKSEYGYAIVEGQVMNLTGRRIDRIEAVAVFKTAGGALVTSSSSLIEYRPLLPGQTSPFKIYTTANPAMKTAALTFKVMSGPTIPYMTKDELERVKSIVEKRKRSQSNGDTQ